MSDLVTRVISGVGLALVLVIGFVLGGGLTETSGVKAQTLIDNKVDPEEAEREALQKEGGYRQSEEFYKAQLDAKLEELKLDPIDLETLRQPLTYANPITLSEPKRVEIGASWSGEGLTVLCFCSCNTPSTKRRW